MQKGEIVCKNCCLRHLYLM
uniref:Uncharacterized protein n=1 Tax=Arundo donax TaxID=35708 RepID=A0A0A9HJC1_ARUDO